MENFFRNPFVITPYVREEYFCDRTEETAQLCKHILNGMWRCLHDVGSARLV